MEPIQTNHSWHTPTRQSPAAIFVMLIQTAVALVKGFWPLIIIYFLRTKKDEDSTYLYMILVFGILTIIGSVIRYWFHKFHVSNDNLIITSGWLKKKTLTLPLKSIQAVHLEQNLWQQFLKVAKVSLDSSGSEKVEVKIDALQLHKAEELKELLMSGSERIQEAEGVLPEIKITRLSMADLFKLSLTANHLEAFLILFALSMNLIDDVQKIFNIDGWEMMGDYAGEFREEKVLAITILLIFVALVSTFISIVRTTLKYFDFTLEDTIQGWRINFGLINRQQMLIPYNKIQLLSWRSNLLRRKIDFWILHIQSIGHDEIKHKQHITIPVVRLEQVTALSNAYQKTPVFNIREGSRISEKYWKRKMLLFAVPVTLITCTIAYLLAGNSALWALIIFPVMTWYYYTWNKNFRWYSNNEGLQMYSGVWGRRYTLLAWKKIQQVVLNESIYQRSNGLASINFVTAGGKVTLPFIELKKATHITNLLLYYVESRNEKWM